ncbi:MAG: type III-A CRISPR-associated RAMP protein Csm4 [Oscillospiraceae bacterium]|nr:type III-A CRISPR-associated RAMP protein Csm4 [Oscillospiraceae bacterium]
MNYSIYKLSFRSAVHFGSGRLSSGTDHFYADTLFSALCHEALKLYGENGAEKMYRLVKDGKLLLSDSMPYCGNELYIPKPIAVVDGKRQSDSSMKKKFKKLKYIPICDIDSYFSGSYVPSDSLDKLGKSHIKSCAAVKKDDDNEPFTVGAFTFSENCGLYFVLGTDSYETESIIDELMSSLSYTGIGGKVSAGMGGFAYTYENASAKLCSLLENNDSSVYMSLSVSMAADSELETVVEGASYELIKRSGFIASPNAESTQKKRDFYCFKGGSCFTGRFMGDVFDVSAGDSHPVYRYCVPMMIGIR